MSQCSANENSVLSSVSALHRNGNSVFGAFPCNRGIVSEVRIPDSSSVSQCYRDMELIPCSGLAGSGLECLGSRRRCPSEGVSGWASCGVCGRLLFWPSALNPLPQTTLS